MKLRNQSERTPHQRSVEVITILEQDNNPYVALEALLTPEVRAGLLSEGRMTEHSIDQVLASEILNQVIHEPVKVDELKLQAEQLLPTLKYCVDGLAIRLTNTEVSPNFINDLTTRVRFYPDQRQQLAVSDQLFDKWMQLLDQQDRSGSGVKSSYTMAQMLFDLAILRPDKLPVLKTYLYDHGWDQVIWRAKRLLTGGDATSVAQVRVLDSNFVLTEEERAGYIQEYHEVQKVDLLKPSIAGWANLAMLLAPTIEIDSQGNVILGKVQGKIKEAHPLPVRPQV